MNKLYTYFIKFPWIIPTIIFAVLVILGANMHPLWGDEAETALFARNILKFGLPVGWDGVNIISFRSAEVLNENLINNIIPWPQLYLTALSFWIFGESSFSARLPFVLISILSIPLLYVVSLKITGSKISAFLTVVIASLSVPYILFAYQARYYSLTMLSTLLFLLAVFSLEKKVFWPKLLFVLSTALFLYNNFISFPEK